MARLSRTYICSFPELTDSQRKQPARVRARTRGHHWKKECASLIIQLLFHFCSHSSPLCGAARTLQFACAWLFQLLTSVLVSAYDCWQCDILVVVPINWTVASQHCYLSVPSFFVPLRSSAAFHPTWHRKSLDMHSCCSFPGKFSNKTLH